MPHSQSAASRPFGANRGWRATPAGLMVAPAYDRPACALPSLLTPLYASAAMRAMHRRPARVQRMLDFEAALARAEAAVGVDPGEPRRRPIGDACKAERYDLAALAEAAIAAGNIAIPLVDALTAEVAKRNKEAAGYVHWGATSQDVIDTALVLELRAAIDALLDGSRPRHQRLHRARRPPPPQR